LTSFQWNRLIKHWLPTLPVSAEGWRSEAAGLSQEATMLDTVIISGEPQIGKATAALAYARSAATAGHMVLIVSPSFKASKRLTACAGAWSGRARNICGRLMHIKGIYRIIIVDDGDHLSKGGQQDVEVYAGRSQP
jgi:DNA polymerase III delta prime subunit